MKLLKWIGAGIAVFFAIVIILNLSMTKDERARGDAVRQAEAAVSATLKDPDSAKFSDVEAHPHPDGKITVCGVVNARNGFGGYAGPSHFVVATIGAPPITEEA